jgi:UDP-N-acetylglucosamine transferase subunit ALG13
MIFATVGTQLPFPRLLLALDAWAAAHPQTPVVAQTGADDTAYPHLTTMARMGQADFARHMETARIVVSHAGMGTILNAAETGKPVIVVPRLAVHGEHRNDHQVDTAAEMSALSVVHVVDDVARLGAAIDALLAADLPQATAVKTTASPELITALQDFIWSGVTTRPAISTRGALA